MKRIILFINSLEQREKIILLAGIYAFIIIAGIFIATSYLLDRIDKTEKKINREIQSYIELQKIVSEYKRYRPSTKKESLSLSTVEEIAEKSGIKSNILSLKPYQQDYNSVEVSFEKISGDRLILFLKQIKEKGFYVLSLSINDPKGNRKLNVRTVIGERP
ncbi:type II secretion system protein GspM [Persephonella sp.]